MFSWSKTSNVFTTNTGIEVKDVHSDDTPQFERCYTLKLGQKSGNFIDDRITLRISLRTFVGRRCPDAELRQTDGRWVSFDPTNIAEKIIDRTLINLVQKGCDEIIALDKTFSRNLPNEYTDKDGTKWKRVA